MSSPHAGSNHLKRCRCAYITVADPGVSVLPRAEGARQGVVGSLLVLLGSRRLAAGMRLLPVLTLVGRPRLVERDPHLVVFGLLRPGPQVGSAVAMEGVGGVPVVWPVAPVVSRGELVGVSCSRASLSVGASRPGALARVRLQRSDVRSSPVPVPPRGDLSDPPKKTQTR